MNYVPAEVVVGVLIGLSVVSLVISLKLLSEVLKLTVKVANMETKMGRIAYRISDRPVRSEDDLSG